MKTKTPIVNGSDDTAANLSRERRGGDAILDPSAFEVRLTGRKEPIDQETELLKGRGFVASGLRKMAEPDVYRAYLVKGAPVQVDEDEKRKLLEVAAKEHQIPILKTCIEAGLTQLAKAEKALEGMDDPAHMTVKILQKDLIAKLSEGIRQKQHQLTRLENDVQSGRAELEEAKRKQGIIEWLKQNPPLCECGLPGVIVGEPIFRGSDWWLPYRCSEENPYKCAKRWNFYPDKELVVTEKGVVTDERR